MNEADVKISEEEVKGLIKCIHKIWYSDWLDNLESRIKLHQHLGELFNYAGITETLCENNPEETTPEQVLEFIKSQDKK